MSAWGLLNVLSVVEIIVAYVMVGDVVELVVLENTRWGVPVRRAVKWRTARRISAADMTHELFDNRGIVYGR